MNERAPEGRISVRVDSGVAAVRIDNPAHKNALTKGMCQELQALMPRLDSDPAAAVITIRGAGETFSSGAAINELTSVLLDPQEDGSHVDHLSLADSAIAAVRKPTIAVVDGACMGGGWQLASACDFIVASERSVFAITPAKIGVIYPRAGIERLLRQVGPANAKYILFGGETFGAVRAAQLGLVSETVADDHFERRVDELVTTLRNRSRFSIHTLKQLINESGSTDADGSWQKAWAAMTENPDMGIGIAAFLRRERPEFAWRPDQDQ
jgi:enoyl-CoA hydratase/carnithine racemase